MYTGNTLASCVFTISSPVYPCVYREHLIEITRVVNGCGLSLCIQGTLGWPFLVLDPFRFIPVYTGNTTIAAQAEKIKAVYPCVYREHVYFVKQNRIKAGLSLCIQGTLATVTVPCSSVRFIPVYTGNTFAVL